MLIIGSADGTGVFEAYNTTAITHTYEVSRVVKSLLQRAMLSYIMLLQEISLARVFQHHLHSLEDLLHSLVAHSASISVKVSSSLL